MSTSLTIGGTANFRAIDETSFSVTMTGTFDGGVYAMGYSALRVNSTANSFKFIRRQ